MGKNNPKFSPLLEWVTGVKFFHVCDHLMNVSNVHMQSSTKNNQLFSRNGGTYRETDK